MTITREQVADLCEGDVVELRDCRHADLVTTGPVTVIDGVRRLGPWNLIGHPVNPEQWTLTVVSRAPRPLYVNHPRTEPVAGDVARTPRGGLFHCVTTERWAGSERAGASTPWRSLRYGAPDTEPLRSKGMTLLVDGETGTVVTP